MGGRFSIRAAMGLVLLAALGVAALRSASEVWGSLAFTATLGLLGVAALGAMYRRGPVRAFHGGAAVFGLGYVLLAFGPWSIEHIRPRLLPTRLLDAAFPVVHPSAVTTVRLGNVTNVRPLLTVAFSPDGRTLATSGPAASRSAWQAASASWQSFVGVGALQASFQDIGHCMAALLSALVGGLIARRFHTAGDRDP